MVHKHTQVAEKIISMVESLCEHNKNSQLASPKPVPSDSDEINKEPEKTSDHADLSKVLLKDADGIPHMFLCPINHTVMDKPVVAEDGFTYERKAIVDWLKTHKVARSPMNNSVIGTRLIPNNDLRSAIKQWQDSPKPVPSADQDSPKSVPSADTVTSGPGM